MQQRQPRLGDVVDDYCPRERRVTNHAVVAMVGDEVKQTRCTTCDAEHDYKHAKVPPQRKKKDVPGALYQQVLDGIPRVVPTPDPSLDDEQPAAADEPDGGDDRAGTGSAALVAAEGAPPASRGPGPSPTDSRDAAPAARRRAARAARARVHDARAGARPSRQAEERLPRRRRQAARRRRVRVRGRATATAPGKRHGRPGGGDGRRLEPLGSAGSGRSRSRRPAPGTRRQEAFALARCASRSPTFLCV